MPEAGKFTREERQALDELKSRLKDVHLVKKELLEDRRMINWLRARNMKVDDAEAMFRKHLIFREENKIDTILTTNNIPIDHPMLQTLPVEIIGHDKKGNIILAVAVQEFDVRKLIQTFGREIVLEVLYFLLETAYEEIEKRSQGLPEFKKAVYIVDLEGFRFHDYMSSDVLELLTHALKVVEANYPELLTRAYAINAPLLFSILWNTLKPFLSANTLNKIQIIGQNPEKYQSALLEIIDSSQLPRKWGGTKYSERIPVLNMVTGNSRNNFTEGVELTEATISPSDMMELTFEVAHPKAVLSWVFKVKSYDVGFSLLFHPYPQDKGDVKLDVLADKELIQYRRINSKCEQSGSIVCDMQGHCKNKLNTLRFDNSYSRFRGKTIYYHVEMTPLTLNANVEGGGAELQNNTKGVLVIKSSKYMNKHLKS